MRRSVLAILVISLGLISCSKARQGSLHLEEQNKIGIEAPKPKTVTNKKNLPTYFFFFANWCGYCKRMAPLVQKAEKEFADKVFFYYVDIDDPKGKEIAATYKGSQGGVPHAQFYDKEGNLLDEQLGFVPYEKLESAIRSNFDL